MSGKGNDTGGGHTRQPLNEMEAYMRDLEVRLPEAAALVGSLLVADSDRVVVEILGNVKTSAMCVQIGTELFQNEQFCKGNHSFKMDELAKKQSDLLREEAAGAGVGVVTMDRTPVGDGTRPVIEGGDGGEEVAGHVEARPGDSIPPLPESIWALNYTDADVVGFGVVDHPVPLTQAELNACAEVMATENELVRTLEAEAKEIADQFKAKIKLAQARRSEAAARYIRKTDLRPVGEYRIWNTGDVIVYRADTGEFLERRSPKPEERQTHLHYRR